MAKHRKSRKFIAFAWINVAVLSGGVLTAMAPQNAKAVTPAVCPTGWTLAEFSPALDGIYCDRATDTDVTFEVPAGISEIMYLTVGGGGGGADGHVFSGQVFAGGGGGAGELNSGNITVTPGDTFALTFSVGGAAVDGNNGQDGSDVKYKINTGADTVLSKGGSGGLTSGSGGAAGGDSGLAGGAGSSTPHAIAAGGGGGWAFAGAAGITSPEALAGWGGQGKYFDEGTETFVDAILPIDSHWNPPLEFPGLREALAYNYVIPAGQASTFYDQMGIGGPGGVVVEATGGEDPNVTCDRATGHYLDIDITVSEKGLGTCYDQTNDYYATIAVTPVHPGFGGVGGVGTQQGTNGQTGIAYLRIYVPTIYLNTIDSDQTSIGKDDLVNFTYDAPERSGIGFFVDGNYVGGIPGFLNAPISGSQIWEAFGTAIGGVCREIVFEARLFSPSVVATTYHPETFSFSLDLVGIEGAPPTSMTTYLDLAQVTVAADACDTGGGGGGGGNYTPAPLPVQTSSITSCVAATGSATGGNSYAITGTFTTPITNVSVGGVVLPATAWVQTPTSVTITMPARSAGSAAIQIYNGQSPLLSPCDYTYLTSASVQPLAKALKLKVFFGLGSNKITAAESAKLKAFAKKLAGLGAKITLIVTGYAQPTPGSEKTDGALSKRRASAVAAYLKKAGVTTKVVYAGAGRASVNTASSRYVEIVADNS